MKTFVAIAALSQVGCAAIFASSNDGLAVTSSPPQAEVLVNGYLEARTPTEIPISRKVPQAVEVRAPGYAPQQCSTEMSPGAGYVISDVLWCVLFFPVGCIAFIDADGAWNHLSNSSCSVALLAQQAPAPPVPYPYYVPSTAPGAPASCVPGRSVECIGVAGCQGGQVCSPDGHGYGPCACSSGAPPPTHP